MTGTLIENPDTKALVDQEILEGIASAIREKNSTENKYLPSEMRSAILEIGDTGVGSRQWWLDAYNGRTSYEKAFFAWPMEEIPVIDTSNATTLKNMFGNSNLQKAPAFDLSSCTTIGAIYYNNSNLIECSFVNSTNSLESIDSAFYGCVSLLAIPSIETSNCNNFAYAFTRCLKITEINLDLSNITNAIGMCMACNNLESISQINAEKVTNWTNTFYQCTSLKNISFVSGSIKATISFVSSKLLTDESIQSIIDGLADRSSETETIKVIFTSTIVNERLTSEQLLQISNKNWEVG